MSQTPTDLDQIAPYRQIQERKKLLKRVMAITHALERMQDSLQAVLQLGDASAAIQDIPEKQLQFFHQFRQHMADQSNTKLQQYLLRLQKLISQEVRQILQFSEIDPDDAGMDEVVSDQSLKLLRDFQRRSQTAVGLRVLLAERGVGLPKAIIPVPKRKLKAQLLKIRGKEREQRLKAERQVLDMQKDLKVMLMAPNFSTEIKQQFNLVLDGLEADLNTLRSGAALEGMVLSFESAQAEALSVNEDEPVMLDKVHSAHREDAGEAVPLVVSGWRGFFAHLKRWLNSPWRVSWRQTKDDSEG